MVKILDDSFMVCIDCIMAIVNDDYTGLDYHYSEQESNQRMKAIQDGISNTEGQIVTGDELNDTFSHKPCDCCGSNLAGTRYHCRVLGD